MDVVNSWRDLPTRPPSYGNVSYVRDQPHETTVDNQHGTVIVLLMVLLGGSYGKIIIAITVKITSGKGTAELVVLLVDPIDPVSLLMDLLYCRAN